MRVTGTWPGLLTLRHGWAKATARPWNDVSPGASIRLERGSAEFLASGATQLLDLGAEWVASPPLDDSAASVWRTAGFKPFLRLDLYGRDLNIPFADPTRVVEDGRATDLPAIEQIDHLSFDETWQLGMLGMAEARSATPHSGLLVTREAGSVVGFAIVGIAGTIGYLQRLGVHPQRRGSGHGRSLIRSSLAWCHQRGANQQLLNTQPENEAAAHLYLSEGYFVNEGALAVMRYDR